MSLWSKIRGTAESLFQLGLGGPLWKANSGAIEGRNSADSAYAIVRATDPIGEDDVIIKRNLGTYAATWSASTVRYYAVDYDGGNDSNVGYSDTSMADAGTKAIKTLEHLRDIFPKFGNGRSAVIVVKSRVGGATYRNIANTSDDDVRIIGVYGYFQLLIRGTGTVATAGATAFANDTADKTCCGSQIFAGTNAAGYNPTGSPTNNTFTCQLSGGGAPGLTAEPALINKRIRFDSATATAALRNACSSISTNTSTQIVTSANLPATPTTSDVFYIEEPGVAVSRFFVHSANQTPLKDFTQIGLNFAGFKAVASTQPTVSMRGSVALANLSFFDVPNSTGFSAGAFSGTQDFRISNTYTDEIADVPGTPNTITTGAGMRCEGGITTSNCFSVILQHSCSIQARFQILTSFQFSVGGGSYAGLGVIAQGSGTGPAVTNLGGCLFGNQGSTSIRRLRITGILTECIALSRSASTLYGIDCTNASTSPVIKINGVGFSVAIHDVVGTSGNTGAGLDLTTARDCRILMGTLAVNTFAGAAGQDIQGAGSVYYVHADYARVDLRDANGNHVQGSGLTNTSQPTLLTNDGNANIGQYKVCRITGNGVVRAAIATAAATSGNVAGVSQSPFTSAGPQSSMIVMAGSTWLQFDAGPTAGNMAYLSTATAGNAMDAPPALSIVNQKLRLGIILKVFGTLGLVAWEKDALPVLADGLA